MFQLNENRRILNFNQVFIIPVLFLGLLVFSSLGANISQPPKKHAAAYISVCEKSVVSNPIVHLQVFQKTWILNKDNSDILAFNRNPLTEDKKSDLKIYNLFLKAQEFAGSTHVFLRTHLFPPEPEDPFDFS